MKFPSKRRIEEYSLEGKKQAAEFYDKEQVDAWLEELRKQLEQIKKFDEDWIKLSGVESSRAYGKAQLARQILEDWLPDEEIQKKEIRCYESDWTKPRRCPCGGDVHEHFSEEDYKTNRTRKHCHVCGRSFDYDDFNVLPMI
jgi:hypothetical protein